MYARGQVWKVRPSFPVRAQWIPANLPVSFFPGRQGQGVEVFQASLVNFYIIIGKRWRGTAVTNIFTLGIVVDQR